MSGFAMRLTGSVKQPIELLSGLISSSVYPIALPLVATLGLTLHHPPPFTLATARPRLQPAQRRASSTQLPGVLVIVTFMSKGRVPMRSTSSVEQPIELLYGTYYPIALPLVATLELTLQLTLAFS